MRALAGAIGLFASLVVGCSLDASGAASGEFLDDASGSLDSAFATDTAAGDGPDTAFADTAAEDTTKTDTAVDTADTATDTATDTAPDTITDTAVVDATPLDTSVAPATSCKALHEAAPALPSGVYPLDPDGAGPTAPFDAYCDMVTDGGGWTLILAYAHAAATNPAKVPGTRPTSPNGFSHFGNAQLLSLAAFDSARFFCSTSLHARRIHFKTSNADAVSYVRGIASAKNTDAMWKTGFTPLEGHSARLPASTKSSPAPPFNPPVDSRLTEFPFFEYAVAHFAIAAFGARWECDDWAGSGANQTLHQVWVR